MRYDTLVSAARLAQHLDDPDWRVVDCRFDLAATDHGARDYRLGHIPGAVYAHLDHDLSGPITPDTGRHPLPDPQRLGRWVGEIGITPDRQVIAYDDSGGTMAVRLWWLLRWLGHRDVALLDGGWQAWQQSGLPSESDPVSPSSAAVYPGTPDPSQVVETETLVAWCEQRDVSITLIDARTAERFNGEAEPIDPVAGHIPGAINRPLQENLDADGRFKSPEDLRRLYLGTLGGRPPASVVAMCGSGVTACHNLLAMEIAGLSGGRLYAGSWSEWIRDPARPVATDAG
jgi:thiosulfate/3-mercaptopyruvate sulfurtransferase